jgi:hypothetical protein
MEMLAKKHSITSAALEQIMAIVKDIGHGNITLMTQNFRLIQIERNEKIRPCDLETPAKPEKNIRRGCNYAAARAGILEACQALEYGQVVIVIKNGKIVQIDRTEKQRFPSLVGLNGDGI